MPRNLRMEYEGAIYHVMNRGNRREEIYDDEMDLHLFDSRYICKGENLQHHFLPPAFWSDSFVRDGAWSHHADESGSPTALAWRSDHRLVGTCHKGCWMEIIGMVGTSHHGAAGHMNKAQVLGEGLKAGEHLRFDKGHHFEVFQGGL